MILVAGGIDTEIATANLRGRTRADATAAHARHAIAATAAAAAAVERVSLRIDARFSADNRPRRARLSPIRGRRGIRRRRSRGDWLLLLALLLFGGVNLGVLLRCRVSLVPAALSLVLSLLGVGFVIGAQADESSHRAQQSAQGGAPCPQSASETIEPGVFHDSVPSEREELMTHF